MENNLYSKAVFNAKSNPLPTLKLYSKVLLKLISLPLLNKLSFFKKEFCKSINIPQSTCFARNFYCSSGNLILGEKVSLNDAFILDYAPVIMGNNVVFSFKNMLITSTHDLENFDNVIASPIIIGDNVWITSNVIILGGVKIGSNSVIAAGSVVTKDIPSGVLAGGNPCKVIKQIQLNQ